MAYWLANEHLSCVKEEREYNNKLYQYFRSEEGGNRDVKGIVTVYLVEQNTTDDSPMLVPYALCMFGKDAKTKDINLFPYNLEMRLYKLRASVSDYTIIKHFTDDSLALLLTLSSFEHNGVKLGLVKETVVSKVDNKEEDVFSFVLFRNIIDSRVDYFKLRCLKNSHSEEPGFKLSLNTIISDLTNNNGAKVISGGYGLHIPGDDISVITPAKLKQLIYSVFCIGIAEIEPSIYWLVDENSTEGKICFQVNAEETISKTNESKDKINFEKNSDIRLELTFDRRNEKDFGEIIKKLESLKKDYADIDGNTDKLAKKRFLARSIINVRKSLEHYDTALQVLEYIYKY